MSNEQWYYCIVVKRFHFDDVGRFISLLYLESHVVDIAFVGLEMNKKKKIGKN